MADHFPYRLCAGSDDLTLIWRSGEGAGDGDPDRLLVDESGRLLAFAGRAPLREYCERHGPELIWEGEGELDLGPVRRWVEPPHLAPAGLPELLLEAWNFFEDLSRSLPDGPPLPAQGPVHDSAYEKAFGGEPLAPASGEDAWTAEEDAAVRELLRAGLELWEHAVRTSVGAVRPTPR
ncbi:hypothetical protein ACFRAR_28295 [Kitasatospora sp. NPDC056651]|uniref:hypothetical protein n=1 Tax=Kitasatospora sp. NPDC056651 TaxID=3345892 RepID=UPI0036B0A3D3